MPRYLIITACGYSPSDCYLERNFSIVIYVSIKSLTLRVFIYATA